MCCYRQQHLRSCPNSPSVAVMAGRVQQAQTDMKLPKNRSCKTQKEQDKSRPIAHTYCACVYIGFISHTASTRHAVLNLLYVNSPGCLHCCFALLLAKPERQCMRVCHARPPGNACRTPGCSCGRLCSHLCTEQEPCIALHETDRESEPCRSLQSNDVCS